MSTAADTPYGGYTRSFRAPDAKIAALVDAHRRSRDIGRPAYACGPFLDGLWVSSDRKPLLRGREQTCIECTNGNEYLT